MISGRMWKTIRWSFATLLVLGLSLYLRTSGLFSGLQEGAEWHPDVPKQIRRLGQYLQGNHTAYAGGDLFYDGYPYGLNRVDEGIIRLLQPASAGIRTHFVPAAQSPVPPDNDELYYWVRSLRVVYGMLALLAAVAIAWLLGLSRIGGLFVGLLIGIAPLSITVSHMATGDVGVDLFVAGTFLFTGLWAARKTGILSVALAGMCLGAAFACKYHGLLAIMVPGGYMFLRYGLVERKPVRLLLLVACIAMTLVAAVFVANPLFLAHPSRTWGEFLRNIVFIKNYGASHAFLHLPLLTRIGISLETNIPKVLDAIGWVLSGLAAVGLILSARESWLNRSALKDNHLLILRPVVFLFPFVFVFLSAAGKPEIAPYHFSSLVLPLAMAATYAVSTMFYSSRIAIRVIAAVGLAAMVTESGIIAHRDNTFWQRDYIKAVSDSMGRDFVPTPKDCRWDTSLVVRRLRLERDNVSVSRNKPFSVSVLQGDRWRAIGVPPVPWIPYPRNFDWIFMNGPVFPRNDRMFRIPLGASDFRQVVMDSKPAGLRLGVRSGFNPLEITIEAGGQKQKKFLPPDSYEVVNFADIVTRAAHTRGDDVHLCALRVSAEYGDAWVTVLGSELETDNFLLFSGKTDVPRATRVVGGCQTAEISDLVDRALYLDGEEVARQKIGSGESLRLFTTALGAGVYKLELEVVPLYTNTAIRIVARDLFGVELPLLNQHLTNVIPVNATGIVTARIEKAYAPYEIGIDLGCVAGSCIVSRWRLRPDAESIIANLKSYAAGTLTSAWLGHYKQSLMPSNQEKLAGIMFGAGLELEDASFPANAKAGRNDFLCLIHTKPPTRVEIGSYHVFLHFLDADGRQRGVTGVTLQDAVSAGRSGTLLTCLVPGDLPAGEYAVWMGVYNTNTGDRLPLTVPPGSAVQVDADNRLLVGRTMVSSPAVTTQ